MDKLPNEVIEIILALPALSFQDVVNFGATCKYYTSLVRASSSIWKTKYQKKWPEFVRFFSNHFTEWYKEIMYIHNLRACTRVLLASMSTRFYKQNELSETDFPEWCTLMKESNCSYHYMIMDLMNILNDCSPIKSMHVVPINTPGNKTQQYYARKALRFLRQKYLTKLWDEFNSFPYSKQLLEVGAVFIAQWCQPAININSWDIVHQLDTLANEVMQELQKEHPDHPLLSVSKEVLREWRFYNLKGNMWGVVEGRQIMECLLKVFYTNHKFGGNVSSYYMAQNSYINEVLIRKQGLPITLSVVFESVARRVGLKCEPYGFPSHFLLKFTEGNCHDGESYYIDVFNHGNKIQGGCCPRNPHGIHANPHGSLVPASPKQVVQRMANNLQLSSQQITLPGAGLTALRSSLELIHVVHPHDVTNIISLAQLYMKLNIDTKPLEIFLNSEQFKSVYPQQALYITHRLRDYDLHRKHNFSEPIMQPESKVRPRNLTYAVGMVMQHVILKYYCVIYDWDPTCIAPGDWQKQMEIEHRNLKYGRDQPFYRVLIPDGSQYYVAEEHLMPNVPSNLDFPEEIGKHFSHFFDTHYVPNAEKEQEFSGDAEVRHMFYQQIRFGS